MPGNDIPLQVFLIVILAIVIGIVYERNLNYEKLTPIFILVSVIIITLSIFLNNLQTLTLGILLIIGLIIARIRR
ncbi:hypothetical protein [Sulfolobus acidocaldarius]|uniref:Uncharacterized protein n=3 Tax=Sulfolobus acidocaldarius TaxID=2285 RepID=A0A0U2N9C5_9CREN|nr:hypothetical protein [Sulfolobus acidocaldarius]AGE70687.1 hypothetical protein SacN8_03570 [Sulfolobus acidocaldarius N8]AGE72959.1 hypothetical protein SacRon12I_03555 [Sulfolobus acidocaldarius Ron12/I]ALU28973.1 hypothetical protein ATY89_02735 [Sulfolobus acidocaldarius]ALU31700.1 hypothetical protein ATZ20_05760 [Sulfolobus acidocaldarius]WCM34660.1 hypothetical protein GO597_04590 [Sulfolobus acidocaldarius DSM 639]